MWPLYYEDVKKQIDYDSNSKGGKIEICAMCMGSFIYHGQFSLLYSTQIRSRDTQVRARHISHTFTHRVRSLLCTLHFCFQVHSIWCSFPVILLFPYIDLVQFDSLTLCACVFRFNLMIFPCALINKIESMWFRWVFFFFFFSVCLKLYFSCFGFTGGFQ